MVILILRAKLGVIKKFVRFKREASHYFILTQDP